MIVEGTCKGSLDEKRVELPGLVIVDECPACHAEYRRDVSFDYPRIGTEFVVYAYCSGCGHEWEMGKVRLDITLTVVP